MKAHLANYCVIFLLNVVLDFRLFNFVFRRTEVIYTNLLNLSIIIL